ncbi:MAG: EAL domain-containing protein [Cyanobium sp.]
MDHPLIPDDDAARVLELRSYGILDSESDPCFDDIGELARRLAATEIGIISLVDSQRQWFKSCVGAPYGQMETPREISFCAHTILQREPLIINDALADPRFSDHPLVLGEFSLRFYAGFPLISPNGFVIGSLCAISREPHQLSEQQIDSLRRLASLTMQQLERLRASQESEGQSRQFRRLASERLPSLDRLVSRDQMVQMLDLFFEMELDAPFTLLRCCFLDYERVNSTLVGVLAEEYMNEAARRVQASLPRAASVARFADAELVVLVPLMKDEDEARKVSERILAFSHHNYRQGNHSLSMPISIGVAIRSEEYQSSEMILADTSMAVRMARRSSGNAFRLIDAQSRVEARDSYRLESEFREAVASKVLEPYLQPIVDLRTAEPLGFEALARWPCAQACLLPSQFIPLASQCGLTGELDLLILEKSLAALPLLAQQIPNREMKISLNLSGILLEDSDLRSRFLGLIDESPRPPGWTLQVELVEDIFQDTSEGFSLFLDQLVSRGVRIAIDDFGTGYSSLARLISLPIQEVKIDRAFVLKLADQSQSPRTLLRTMLSMLNDLGLEITAEGVETPPQRDWLLANGACKGQGYLFSQPLPISETIVALQQLGYRPRAIPVDRGRIRAARRRRLGSWFRLPYQADRRSLD